LAEDVLAWLQEEEALQVGSAQFRDLKVSFDARRASNNVKTEENRKFIMAGSLAGGSCSGALCGLSLKASLPLPRLQAWFRAFKRINQASHCACHLSGLGHAAAGLDTER
jgi:hypothetical protein